MKEGGRQRAEATGGKKREEGEKRKEEGKPTRAFVQEYLVYNVDR